MARLRTNFVTGTVSDNPLLIGATTLNSAGLADLEAVSGSDIAVIVLDPESKNGDPEIVYVTAHTASATSATITRGQEGTTARQHISGTRWIHGPLENDFDHGNLSGLTDDDHTIYVKADASRNITGEQNLTRSASTDNSLQVRVSSDTQPRFQVRADGRLSWGAGSASAVDTNLYRDSANILKTDDSLSVAGGTVYIGSDCSLYRASADNLQTDDSLKVSNTLTAGSVLVPSSTSATESLKIKVSAESNDRLVVTANGAMLWGSGSAVGDTNLYRSAADTLRTDDTFVATRIDVGSNTYAFIPVGAVIPFAGSTAPNGFLLCFGQAISRTTYVALWTLLSTTYGSGDGVNTFNVPDLRGRVVAGLDNMGGTGASRLTGTTITGGGDNLGEVGGSQTHTLASGELAQHSHTLNSHTHNTVMGTHGHFIPVRINDWWYDGFSNPHRHYNNAGTVAEGPANFYGADSGAGANAGTVIADLGTKTSGSPSDNNTSTTPTSSTTAHNNVQPTMVLNYIIKF